MLRLFCVGMTLVGIVVLLLAAIWPVVGVAVAGRIERAVAYSRLRCRR